MAPGIVAMPGLIALMTSTSGCWRPHQLASRQPRPEAHTDAVAARRAEAGGLNLHDDAVPQRELSRVSPSISCASIGTDFSIPTRSA